MVVVNCNVWSSSLIFAAAAAAAVAVAVAVEAVVVVVAAVVAVAVSSYICLLFSFVCVMPLVPHDPLSNWKRLCACQ